MMQQEDTLIYDYDEDYEDMLLIDNNDEETSSEPDLEDHRCDDIHEDECSNDDCDAEE